MSSSTRSSTAANTSGVDQRECRPSDWDCSVAAQTSLPAIAIRIAPLYSLCASFEPWLSMAFPFICA